MSENQAPVRIVDFDEYYENIRPPSNTYRAVFRDRLETKWKIASAAYGTKQVLPETVAREYMNTRIPEVIAAIRSDLIEERTIEDRARVDKRSKQDKDLQQLLELYMKQRDKVAQLD